MSKDVTVGDINEVLVPAFGERLRVVVMTEARRLIAQGKAEGKAEGESKGRAHALLAVLAARGLVVPETVRTRVIACSDIATLDSWIAHAATAPSADAIVAKD